MAEHKQDAAKVAVAEQHLVDALRARDAALNSGKVTLRDFDAVQMAQRELASAKGEEHAIPLDLGFNPEAAVSEPVLLQTDHAVVLTFSAVRQTTEGRRADAGYAVVEFDCCSVARFGYPNDEALPGHPLAERGLGAYGIYEVVGSSWVKKITAQNRVAFPNAPNSSEHHYILTFHDSTFECIASGLRASLSDKNYRELFAELTERVLGDKRHE